MFTSLSMKFASPVTALSYILTPLWLLHTSSFTPSFTPSSVLHALHCRRGNLQLSVPRWRLSWPPSKWIRSESHDIFRHHFWYLRKRLAARLEDPLWVHHLPKSQYVPVVRIANKSHQQTAQMHLEKAGQLTLSCPRHHEIGRIHTSWNASSRPGNQFESFSSLNVSFFLQEMGLKQYRSNFPKEKMETAHEMASVTA